MDTDKAYRLEIRETLRSLSDQALRFQDSIIQGGINREECDREVRRRQQLQPVREERRKSNA